MRANSLLQSIAVALGLTGSAASFAQTMPTPPAGAAPTAVPKGSAEVLKGTWVRPDGGYRIVIQGIGADGKLDAMYYNPAPLQFSKAKFAQVGASFRVALELQAGGYAGSTYDLVYEPASDRLKGTYYQAVAQQKFDVYFVRK